MLSSGANSCSLAEQSFGKGPLYPLFTTGSSSLVAGTGRGQLSSRFFNQSTDPNFLVSESGLISMEGSSFFSWIPPILWLWWLLCCSV